MRDLKIHRRSLLRGAVASGALMFFGLGGKTARAQAQIQRRFVFAYFDGGWDILLGLDPRDPRTTNAQQHQIEPGYGQLAGQYQARGVQTRGNLRFGPAVPPEFLAHADRCSIINAVGMDTAAHEVGRRYFITGRFPRGLSAVGSSTPAEIAAQVGDSFPITHLSAGVESYATGLPSHAAAFSVNSAADMLVALTPFAQVDPKILEAVQGFQDENPGCVAESLDRDGLSSTLLRNQQRARSYIEAQLDAVFDLRRTDPEMTQLRTLYGLNTVPPNAPEALAFVAGQALKKNISQCVSVRVTEGLDTHANWAADQPVAQERGWRVLAALMSDLRNTPASEGSSESLLDHTTIVAFSEFGRTPLFNNLQGRDHFLGNSCLIAGAGVKSGLSIGASEPIGMMPQPTHLATGVATPNATAEQLARGEVVTLSPKHVIATLLASAGLDYEYLRSAPIAALL